MHGRCEGAPPIRGPASPGRGADRPGPSVSEVWLVFLTHIQNLEYLGLEAYY